MAKKTGKGVAITSTVIGTLLVAAILILINIISSGTFFRLDLTEGKEFTTSDATREMLREMDDLVTITVYMSEELPTQLSSLRRQISDMLDEYRNYGRGNIQIDFVDPAKDPQIERKMRTLGIPQITAQILEKDQFQSVNIYMGIAVSYLDRQEVLPVVQDTYTLEYDLTSAIMKVSRDEDYVVGILSGPVEHELTKDLNSLNELLRKQYTTRPVDLRNGESEVPADIDLLIVCGPKNVPDAVQYRLDQFVMKGGKVVFMIDGITIPEGGGLQAMPIESGLEDLLAHYGVRVQKSLVLDRINATASFSSGYVRYSLPYPYWPKAVPDLMNAENPVTNRLESVVLPWTAPLEVDVPIAAGDPIGRIRELEKQNKEARQELADRLGVEIPAEEQAGDEGEEQLEATLDSTAAHVPLRADVLSRTSPSAWKISGRYDLNPQQRFAPPGGETNAEVTAVALTGTFSSYYTDNEVPPLTPEIDDETGETLGAATTETPITTSPETRIIVIGNGLFATDQFMGQFPDNSLFVLNAIDWMTLGDRLISIRSRGATDRPLKQISDAAKSTVKVVGILGTPLLVIAFGLTRLLIRRRSSALREAEMRVG